MHALGAHHCRNGPCGPGRTWAPTLTRALARRDGPKRGCRRANGPLPGRAAGIQDARARSRAERTWGKDLSRLAKLASARQSGAAPSGFHLGHRAHAS
jgi:hypothetical protein